MKAHSQRDMGTQREFPAHQRLLGLPEGRPGALRLRLQAARQRHQRHRGPNLRRCSLETLSPLSDAVARSIAAVAVAVRWQYILQI